MVSELRLRNHSQQLYNRAFSTAYRGTQIWNPSLWLLKDPEAEEKMIRTPIIGGPLEDRWAMVAGNDWMLKPKIKNSERSPMALMVGNHLVRGIKKFTNARQNLARAHFSGSRFGIIHGHVKKLQIGDGKSRNWWVPHRIEDQDWRAFRQVPHVDPATGKMSAHWQHWNVGRADWDDLTTDDAVQVLRHVYEDDQASMNHGRAQREQLGIIWYTWEHVFNEGIQAIERFAQGILAAKIDGARDADGLPNDQVISGWQTTLENMRARHVLVYDKSDDVQIIAGGGQGWQMMKEWRDDLQQQASTLILKSNLPTNADGGGSYALGKVQENSTARMVYRDRTLLEETFTDDLLTCIWQKNHANMVELRIADQMPLFSISTEQNYDPMERVQVAQVMNAIGVPLAADELYEQAGFTKPEEGEEVIEGAAAPQAVPPMPGASMPFARMAAPSFLPDHNPLNFFDESKVKRGQPENKGQFAPKEGGGAGADKEDSKDTADTAPGAKPHGRVPSQEYLKAYGEWARGVTPQEMEALSDWSRNGYYEIKGVLKHGAEMTPQIQAKIDALTSALDKAPAKEGTFYRGMGIPEAARHLIQPGKQIGGKSFTSWSDDPSMGEQFLGQVPGNRIPIMMTADLSSAKDISAFSRIPQEMESLTKPNARLEIVSVTEDEIKVGKITRKILRVHAREVPGDE